MTVATTDIRERLALRPDPGEFEAIRRLWIDHSKAEDARDLDGLMATLTDDCVYKVVWTGHTWERHEGARRFYTELLTAFPDIHFDLTDVVVGPQGVFEVADVTGTWKAPWLGEPPDGEKKQWQVVIHFPWDSKAQRFTGENVYPGPTSPAGGA